MLSILLDEIEKFFSKNNILSKNLFKGFHIQSIIFSTSFFGIFFLLYLWGFKGIKKNTMDIFLSAIC